MKIKYIYIFLFSLLVISACQKEENKRFNYQNGVEASRTYVAAEQMMAQLMNTYFKSITDSTLYETGYAQIDGADVYLKTNPLKIEIKYPYWSVFDGYGHRRAGIILATPSTTFVEPESMVNLTFTDFTYDWDSVKVDSMYVYNVGFDFASDYVFNVVAQEVSVKDYDSAGTMYFDMNQQFKSSDNDSTSPDKFDRFEISGDLNGSTFNLIEFSSTISDGSYLIYGPDCLWLSGGVVNLNIDRFIYPAQIYFAEPDSCGNQFLILMNDDPFIFPIDAPATQ